MPRSSGEGQRVAMMAPGPDPPSALLADDLRAGASAGPRGGPARGAFSAAHQPAVVAAFLDRLAGLAVSGWRVIVVVRADHLGGLAASVVVLALGRAAACTWSPP